MNIPFLDLKAQYHELKHEIDDAISSTLSETSFIGGQALTNFEQNFAKYCHSDLCVGVGNGTDALIISLKALGVGPGDEVITVANSFIATSEAISAAGAKVVFVDCEPNYYTIDTDAIEKSITEKTKAIIPVHLYGQPADMNEVIRIAKRYNLYVVEDCAQAHGAEFQGKRVGSFGDLATFSFYPGKNLGAYGDGGAIVTNDVKLGKLCRMIANHGRTEKYNHEFEGLNSRLDSLQCKILDVKLKYLDKWNEMRSAIALEYSKSLMNVGDLDLPEKREDSSHVYHIYATRTRSREALMNHLKREGIATGIHYPIALHNLQAYKYLNHQPGDFPNANMFQDEIFSLPIYPELDSKMVDYVVSSIKGYF